MTLAKEFLDALACPKCKGELDYRPEEQRFVCSSCRLSYLIRQDIPVLLVDQAVSF